MILLNLLFAIANLVLASLNVHKKDYGMATFNFGSFLVCLSAAIVLSLK